MPTFDSTMWTIIRTNLFNAISEEFDLIVYILLANSSFPINKNKAVSDTCNVSIFIIPHSPSVGGGNFTLKLILAKIIWWWHCGRREGKTPDSEIKFGCEQNIRSIHEGFSPDKNE